VTEASLVTYDDSANGIGTDVQAGMDTLAQRSNDNLLINGGFEDELWQRGVSFTKTGSVGSTYTADRWNIDYNNAANVITASKQGLPTDYVVSELAGKNYFAFGSQTVINGTVNVCRTNVENIVPLLGNTLTLSFYANTGGGVSDTFGLEIFAGLGVGGGSLPLALDETVTMTSADLAKYTYTFTVPEADGEVIGVDNNLSIQFLSTTVQSINIAQVKLEYGNTETPYQARPIVEELALCQRYYIQETVTVAATYDAGYFYNVASIGLPQTMRTVPAVIPISYASTGHGGSNQPILVNANERSVCFRCVQGDLANRPYGLQAVITYSADAEIY
jgi:hypothetical protein